MVIPKGDVIRNKPHTGLHAVGYTRDDSALNGIWEPLGVPECRNSALGVREPARDWESLAGLRTRINSRLSGACPPCVPLVESTKQPRGKRGIH